MCMNMVLPQICRHHNCDVSEIPLRCEVVTLNPVVHPCRCVRVKWSFTRITNTEELPVLVRFELVDAMPDHFVHIDREFAFSHKQIEILFLRKHTRVVQRRTRCIRCVECNGEPHRFVIPVVRLNTELPTRLIRHARNALASARSIDKSSSPFIIVGQLPWAPRART